MKRIIRVLEYLTGKWMSITDYALYKKISVSTIRRYIKANKVEHKSEDGKYFIYVGDYKPDRISMDSKSTDLDREIVKLKKENKELKIALQHKTIQLNEFKMLISIYEREETATDVPPDLPPEFLS